MIMTTNDGVRKVVIFAGGKGTRLQEETKGLIPKPMVTIGGVPILEHIIGIYTNQGYREIIIAAGYKHEIIHDWGEKYKQKNTVAEKLTIVNTGMETQTGGRLLRLADHFEEGERFFLTYGDGLGNINLPKLEVFHNMLCQSQKDTMVTLTAVHPPARFGALELQAGYVTRFAEKRQIETAYINGGFYIVDSNIFEIIRDDSVRFEYDILPNLAEQNKLGACVHNGYWQMMDTPRNRRQLERDFKAGKPWLEGR